MELTGSAVTDDVKQAGREAPKLDDHVFECLERMGGEGEPALEEIRTRHADALRTRLGALREAGPPPRSQAAEGLAGVRAAGLGERSAGNL